MTRDKKENRYSRQEKELLATLEKLGETRFKDEDILQRGEKLVIPERMTIEQVITFLNDKQAADKRLITMSRTYNYRPYDGAYCTWQVLKRTFGSVLLRGSTMSGFFGEAIETRPETKNIKVGHDQEVEIPWGEFRLPVLPDTNIQVGFRPHLDFGAVFELMVTTPAKNRGYIEGIFRLVQKELEENSIYRGKAFDGQHFPEFLDLEAVDQDKVVFSEETGVLLDANLWSVIRYHEALSKSDIDLKRATLLFGDYGTGKTLAAFITAQLAVAHGWTFLYVRPGEDDLQEVMATAALYQPAVVFCEDIDNLTSADVMEGSSAERLLSLFDGIMAKGTEIVLVLTTNHPKTIHKAMLRPGRLDAIIELGKLDPKAIERLVTVTMPPGVLDPHIMWDDVASAMESYVPAFITEATEGAFRYALARNQGDTTGLKVSEADLVNSAKGLRPQWDLMQKARETKVEDSLSKATQRVVETAIRDIQREVAQGQ